MTEIVGVRFERAGKVYHFTPGSLELETDDWVVVETVHGLALGQIAIPRRPLEEREQDEKLKSVVRKANSRDLLVCSYHRSREARVLERCREKVAEHGLDMQVLRADCSFDGDRITFYFTARNRVDFRALARDLSRTLRTHVELRQLGSRDELRLLGGWGPCGRALCCATWMTDFKPVSIRMAKAQGLPLNPESISGHCGRLCCCLRFEYEQYLSTDETEKKPATP